MAVERDKKLCFVTNDRPGLGSLDSLPLSGSCALALSCPGLSDPTLLACCSEARTELGFSLSHLQQSLHERYLSKDGLPRTLQHGLLAMQAEES